MVVEVIPVVKVWCGGERRGYCTIWSEFSLETKKQQDPSGPRNVLITRHLIYSRILKKNSILGMEVSVSVP